MLEINVTVLDMASSRSSVSKSAGRASIRPRGGGSLSDSSTSSTGRSSRRADPITRSYNPLVPDRKKGSKARRQGRSRVHTPWSMQFDEYRGSTAASANRRALLKYDDTAGRRATLEAPAGLLRDQLEYWRRPRPDDDPPFGDSDDFRWPKRHVTHYDYMALASAKYEADRLARLERPVQWVQDRWRYLRQRPYMPMKPLTGPEEAALRLRGISITRGRRSSARPYDVARARYDTSRSRRPAARPRKASHPVRNRR